VNKWPEWLNRQPTWRFALVVAGSGLALFLIALGIQYLVTDGRVDLSYTVGYMCVAVVGLTGVAIYDRRRASRQRQETEQSRELP
jgi:hypothetical protein